MNAFKQQIKYMICNNTFLKLEPQIMQIELIHTISGSKHVDLIDALQRLKEQLEIIDDENDNIMENSILDAIDQLACTRKRLQNKKKQLTKS